MAALAFGLVAGLSPQSARAQSGERWRERQAERREAMREERASKAAAQKDKGEVNPRAMAGLPPKWVSDLREMPPDDQERFMQNNERFQSLSPERQQQIRQNLQKWNQLNPDQKDRLRATEQMLEQMTPEQREHFQNDLVPKLAQMPPDRRQRVLAHWRMLQGMTPAEQQAALNNPKFMPGLSPDEQATVRDLNSMGSPPPQQP